MNIKLNVQKNTFRQYLLELGYNYNIIEYQDLIEEIGNEIKRDVLESIQENKLEETINKIFQKDIGILFLSDIYKIDHIKEEYLKDLIEEGFLSIYFENEIINLDDEIAEHIYIKERIKNLEFEKYHNTLDYIKKDESVKDLFIKNSALDKKMKKFKNSSNIELSTFKKNELDNKIKDLILNINNSMFRDEYTFRIKEYGFSNGTIINIDFNKLKEYVYEKIKGSLSLDNLIEGYFRINVDTSNSDIKIREEINKRLINIEENDKNGLINIISFLQDSNYNKESYTRNLWTYLEKNAKQRIYWSDFNQGETIFDKLRNLEEFAYIAEMEDLIFLVLKTIYFNLSVKVNDKEILISFEEMKDNLLIS